MFYPNVMEEISLGKEIIEETGQRKKTDEVYGKSRCSPRGFYGCIEIK